MNLFYNVLIEFNGIKQIHGCTKKLNDDYNNFFKLKIIFGPILTLKNNHIELLSKNYAKAFNAETDFYKDINKHLREYKKDDNYNYY